jgi:hypothetical protein
LCSHGAQCHGNVVRAGLFVNLFQNTERHYLGGAYSGADWGAKSQLKLSSTNPGKYFPPHERAQQKNHSEGNYQINGQYRLAVPHQFAENVAKPIAPLPQP